MLKGFGRLPSIWSKPWDGAPRRRLACCGSSREVSGHQVDVCALKITDHVRVAEAIEHAVEIGTEGVGSMTIFFSYRGLFTPGFCVLFTSGIGYRGNEVAASAIIFFRKKKGGVLATGSIGLVAGDPQVRSSASSITELQPNPSPRHAQARIARRRSERVVEITQRL